MNTDESSSTPPPSAKGMAVLFWVGIVLAFGGIMSIAAAEMLMPDNTHGQNGILVFYRAFGPFTIAWTTIAAGAYVKLRTRTARLVSGSRSSQTF